MDSLHRARKEVLVGLTLWLLLFNYQQEEFSSVKEAIQSSMRLLSFYWKKKV